MATEIELKLTLPATAVRAFLRHPLLQTASQRSTTLVDSVYYDTPALLLKSSGVVVRRRRQGDVWLQTVKCAGQLVGGLAARPEWESPFSGDFDFSGIDDEAVRTLLTKPSVRRQWIPVFQTTFRRSTWHFPGVLLMLDRGWIIADGQRESICEVEIELAGGQSSDLFALAETLAARCPLLPAPLSKAERGFALRSHVAPQPVRASALHLSPHMSAESAFRTIAWSCLNQLQANCAGATTSDDPEYIHQLRIAIRRLRAAQRVFAPLLPEPLSDEMRQLLDQAMRQAGEARDLDVLVDEILTPAQAALAARLDGAALSRTVDERRAQARRTVQTYIAGREFGLHLIRLTERLHAPRLDTATESPELIVFARQRLRKLRRKVQQLAQAAQPDNPASLHALRIGIKRLRYAQEFFASQPSLKPTRRDSRQLAAWQTLLGHINDLINAGPLLLECAGANPDWQEAVAHIGRWHVPRYQHLMASVGELLAQRPHLRSARSKRPS